MEQKERLEQLREMIEPVVTAEGMELLDIEFRRERQGYVLRVFIDHEDGINLDDCSRISNVLGDLLDVMDPIHHPYHLEVSSPGLNRPLRRPEHFARYRGSIIVVKTAEPIENRRNFKGVLQVSDGEHLVIECEGKVFNIPLSTIKKAELAYFDTYEMLQRQGQSRKRSKGSRPRKRTKEIVDHGK